jgi:hypothetical protein
MKKNPESRYLSLKRLTAYAPSALFLRNSILKIAKEYQFMTIRGLGYITNRVLVFLVVSSCSISVIEAIYFFSTHDRLVIKLRFSSIIYILSLDFSFQSILKFTSKFILRSLSKFILSSSILSYRFQVLIKSISIRSLILFLIRVIRNTTNILTLPMTGPAFLLDKLLEPVEIRWFYRPLPINESGPFFFN